MEKKVLKLKVGKDSVVYGNVEGEVGDGSVVIGPTDTNGNVILNNTMAIGRGAWAGPNSISIGAGAGAGQQVPYLINQLGELVERTGEQKLVENFNTLVTEISNSKAPLNKSKINTALEYLKNAATLNSALELLGKIKAYIATLQ